MRKLLQNKKAGFTLIELMIVVAILGILAAIAIPAFVTYIRRAKSAEATDQVKKMYNAASVYYDKAHMASGALDASAFEHCSVAVVAEGTIFTPTSEKQTGDYAAVSSFAQNGGLGFNVEFAYYDYSIPVSTAACTGGPNNSAVYTLRARGDLDGDGTFSTFDLAVGSNEENELYHARSFYITNETE